MQSLAAIKEKEIVIQSNAISRGIYTCSPLARKLIHLCILKVNCYQDSNQENSEIDPGPHYRSTFPISEAINKLGITKGSNTYKQMKRAVEELVTATIQVENTEEKFKAYTWFSSAEYDQKKDLIDLEFNPPIGHAITEWKTKKQFSAMNIKTIGELGSFFALRFFEIACSWYNTKGRYGNRSDQWTFSLTVDQIRNMFKIDKDAYKDRMNNFITKVVKNPLEELNSVNKDFQITYQKVVENHRTIGFDFTCTQKELLKIAPTDTDEQKAEKKQINEESMEVEYFKNKYPKEFAEAMMEISTRDDFSFGLFEPLQEAKAVELLKAKNLD